ncbi:MAG TPA: TlpA disulfide reductase family protein [Saprospiraceae bacterium]|nr:TlpA disulfide reductase family protein [Saprospiraceae bacterium]
MRIFFVLSCIILLQISCLKLGEPFKGLPPGMWRGVLYLSNDLDGFDEKSNGELPFNFEVIYDTPDSFHIVIHNGEERIVVNDIRMGTDRRTARDTLWIDFPVYDSHIKAQYEEDAIEGFWVARNRKDYEIKFKALNGKTYRFLQLPEPPTTDLSGKWECNFEIETEHPYKAIAEFKQEGNKLTGTFMTTTGDDRFLEGQVSGDRLYLSAFDGSHAYLYEAKILPDGHLSGIYRSGKHFKTYWEGHRNDTIQSRDLGDPFSLTKMKNASEAFTLALPDSEGNTIDISKDRFAGKPKIIQIMGTWCPNCRDETNFLLDYLHRHPDPGFEIVGISFERHIDEQKAKQAIKTYRDKLHIPYPVVYGGSNDKVKASLTLPMLNSVVAFPTLIFLDANNKVVSIHTGFEGPATSGYKAFMEEFDSLVEKIKQGHE